MSGGLSVLLLGNGVFDEIQAQLQAFPDLSVVDVFYTAPGLPTFDHLEQYDAVLWQKVMHVNVTAAFALTQVLLPLLKQSEDASVIFTSSGVARVGKAYWGAYSASKFAVTGLAQVLRQELIGTGVTVHLICPPEVNTPMIAAEADTAVAQTRFLKDLVGTMEPELAASKIARAIDRRKAVIVPGVRASAMVWMARHFPEIFARCTELLLRWKFG